MASPFPEEMMLEFPMHGVMLLSLAYAALRLLLLLAATIKGVNVESMAQELGLSP
jgi:hypothetical protein